MAQEQGDPATRPPEGSGTSKAGIACLAILIAIVLGILLVAAVASKAA